MINEEQVKHIADLAKLNIKDEEIEKYKKQLSDIMTEIDKIVEVEIENDDIMISPTDNRNRYSEDIVEEHINRDDAFINAKNKKGDYITVPKVVGGEE